MTIHKHKTFDPREIADLLKHVKFCSGHFVDDDDGQKPHKNMLSALPFLKKEEAHSPLPIKMPSRLLSKMAAALFFSQDGSQFLSAIVKAHIDIDSGGYQIKSIQMTNIAIRRTSSPFTNCIL